MFTRGAFAAICRRNRDARCVFGQRAVGATRPN
jgi:hypothetical protein